LTGAGGLPLLWRVSLRQMARRPGQMALAVMGVALGVAVVVAVDLASRSAARAFELSTEAVTGRATHQIVGGPEGLPESLFPELVLTSGASGMAGMAAAPVVEGWVTLPARPGIAARPLHLLGLDPFSEGGLRPYFGAGGGGADLSALLLRSGTCVLAAPTAAELGLRAGDRFTVRVGAAARTLELAGVVQTAGAGATAGNGASGGSHGSNGSDGSDAVADLLLMDVAAAQELLGRLGKLDRIDLRLAADPAAGSATAGAAQLAGIAALLPPGAQLLPASGRGRDVLEMTRAFRINLTALSLLALLCGAFLIYNTMTFSVVQRRPLLGTLRALGVTRGQVLALVLGEAAAVAVAGTAVGLAGGALLGRILLRMVIRTINDLYFAVSVGGLALSPASLLAGAAIGIGATLAAALAPALEATLTPPRAVLSRSLLEARLRRALPRATALGGALLLLGGALLAAPTAMISGSSGVARGVGGSGAVGPVGTGGGLVLGFFGLGAVIVGCALLAPAATVGLMRLLRPALGALLGVRGRMAAGGVVASLSRTAVAIAALMVAVSVAVGIGVMIDSFRHTVVAWLEQSLQADLYVSAPAGYGGLGGAPIAPELAARAAAVPGVAAVHGVRRVELRSAAGPIRLLAIDADRRRFRGFELLAGDPQDVWRRVGAGEEAMVSEPFARRFGVRPGGVVRLPTSGGERAFRVAGVFYDYTSDRGLVLISRPTYLRFWHDPTLSGFSIDLVGPGGAGAGREPPPGAAAAAGPDRAAAITIRLLRQALGGEQPLIIRGNRELKRLSLEIFDRTFLITGVLRLLAGLVAAIGVLSALSALQLERTREIGVLRAAGLTPGQVWQLVTAQTGLMGLAAGLLSLPVGLLLSAIMVYIINRRSFGWTIHLQIAPAVLLEALLLALATALAAGVYPAWRMARTSPALALREE
jgi:putative ABC transport system permease protein